MSEVLLSFHGDVIVRVPFLYMKYPRHIPSTTKRRKFALYIVRKL